MPEINLTSRKTAPPKIISSHYYDESKREYTGKFSEAYREAGHDFMKSFKVLRLAYLFQYHVLTADDVFLYETLQLLCERGIPFTLERLAEELGMGHSKLRQCLDNLENAELLEIVKSDGQGQMNFYILRTPLFERETIVGDSSSVIRRQNDIVNKGFALPEKFIDEEHPRLIKQIKENRARQMREIARSKELQKQNPQLYKEIKNKLSERLLTWHKIVKKLGSTKAATFDNIIFQLIQKLNNVSSMDYWNVFKARLKEYLTTARINFDSFLLDYGVELAAFYDSRRSDPIRKQPTAPTAAPAQPPIAAEDERAETKDFLVRVLKAEKRGEKLKTINDSFENFVKTLQRVRKHLSIAEIESLAISYVSPQLWQKLSVELRN